MALGPGVSNFGLGQMEALASSGLELPEVNQIELHPWLQQPELVAFCQRHQIQVMGYRPTANGFRFGMALEDPVLAQRRMLVVQRIAERHGKTAAQIAIKWSAQLGYVTIPKTVTTSRMVENAEAVSDSWSLSNEEMAELAGLDEGLHTLGASEGQHIPWALVETGVPKDQW